MQTATRINALETTRLQPTSQGISSRCRDHDSVGANCVVSIGIQSLVPKVMLRSYRVRSTPPRGPDFANGRTNVTWHCMTTRFLHMLSVRCISVLEFKAKASDMYVVRYVVFAVWFVGPARLVVLCPRRTECSQEPSLRGIEERQGTGGRRPECGKQVT